MAKLGQNILSLSNSNASNHSSISQKTNQK